MSRLTAVSKSGRGVHDLPFGIEEKANIQPPARYLLFLSARPTRLARFEGGRRVEMVLYVSISIEPLTVGTEYAHGRIQTRNCHGGTA